MTLRIDSLKHCKDCTRHFFSPIKKDKALACPHCLSLKWQPMVVKTIQ